MVPAITSIDETNAAVGEGSLGLAVERCIIQWRRPPNFLLVDLYDRPNSSALKIAAGANEVEALAPAAAQSASSRPAVTIRRMWIGLLGIFIFT